jgi:hypothetical protein
LIYSDDGNVADPKTQAVVGSYNAAGLVAPDSSLNRVFILGQTQAQAGTNSFTILSFNQTTFEPVSSITLDNIIGSPFQLVRCGDAGLALLTVNYDNGSPILLYLVHDEGFVSNAEIARSAASHVPTTQKLVQPSWKRFSKLDVAKMLKAKNAPTAPRG